MKVCVQIKCFNFHEMTRECVASVRKNAGIEHTLTVIDNGSDVPYEDENADHIIRLDKNIGYTGAVNEGIIWCDNKYDYILVMDNDMVAHRPDFLKHLVDAMEADKDLAIVSSVRYTKYSGKEGIELCGEDVIRGHQSLTFDSVDDLAKLGTMECVWVPGCSLLLRSTVIREIGLLDKRMVTHCSDNDICFRAINAGYKVAYIPKSQLTHIRNVTVNHNKTMPYNDQRVLIEKISGLAYQKIFNTLPLDAESNAWGKISFVVYKK